MLMKTVLAVAFEASTCPEVFSMSDEEVAVAVAYIISKPKRR